MHDDLSTALDRAAVDWLPSGLSVELRVRDPRAPRPDLTPLVGFLGTPVLLLFTVLGITVGTSAGDPLTLLATLGGAAGLLLGQAIVYGAAVLVEELAHARERCRLDVGPNRIRVRRGRKVLLDVPPGQVTAWSDGPALDLVGLGDHVQIYTEHDADLAQWLVGRVREVRRQARTMARPRYAEVRAIDQVLKRLEAV